MKWPLMIPNRDMLSIYLSKDINILTVQINQDYNADSANIDTSEKIWEYKKENLDLIKRSMIMLKENSSKEDLLLIDFHGDEQLMDFDIMEEAVEFCKENLGHRKIGYTMTTNSFIYSDAILDYLKEEDFLLILSLDVSQKIDLNDINSICYVNCYMDKIAEYASFIQREYWELSNRLIINLIVSTKEDFKIYKDKFKKYGVLNKVKLITTLADNINNIFNNPFHQLWEDNLRERNIFSSKIKKLFDFFNYSLTEAIM